MKKYILILLLFPCPLFAQTTVQLSTTPTDEEITWFEAGAGLGLTWFVGFGLALKVAKGLSGGGR